MSLYFFDTKRRCYLTCGSLLPRPNRTAAGMTATANRGAGHHFNTMDKDRLALTVRGTLDALAFGMMFRVERSVCPCCGAKSGKLRLNTFGRSRLRRLRGHAPQGV